MNLFYDYIADSPRKRLKNKTIVAWCDLNGDIGWIVIMTLALWLF